MPNDNDPEMTLVDTLSAIVDRGILYSWANAKGIRIEIWKERCKFLDQVHATLAKEKGTTL